MGAAAQSRSFPPRVVLCNLLDLPVSDQVGTRVTDVSRKAFPLSITRDKQVVPHATVAEVFLRAVECACSWADRVAGLLANHLNRIGPILDNEVSNVGLNLDRGQDLLDGVHSDGRCELASGVPPHPVADHEQIQFVIDEVIVLIVGPLDADVRHAAGGDAHRFESGNREVVGH